MSVLSPITRSVYVSDGVTLVFDTGFAFQSNADVELRIVYADNTVETPTTGFTIAGAGDPDGGTVTLAAPRVAGAKIVIDRATPKTQPVVYTYNDLFPAKTHETALDRLTMITQELQADLDEIAGRVVPILPLEYQGLVVRWRGNWIPNADYTYGDTVRVADQEGSIYVCTLPHHSGPTFDPVNWSLMLDQTGINAAVEAAEEAAEAATDAAAAAASAEATAAAAATAANNAATVADAASDAAAAAQATATAAAAAADAAADAAQAAADSIPDVTAPDANKALVANAAGNAYTFRRAILLNGTSGNFDAENVPIDNVPDPTQPQQAASKQYVDDAITGSGAVPSPGAGDTDNVLTATGVATFDWLPLAAYTKAQTDAQLAAKQNLDGMLTALSALVTAADKGLYFTGPDAPALFDLSAYARTLLDDANAPTARATLGAASLAANTFTGIQDANSGVDGQPAYIASSVSDTAVQGPSMRVRRLSPTPANNDIGGAYDFVFNDSALVGFVGAAITSILTIANAATRAVGLLFSTTVAGVTGIRFRLGAGLFAEGQADMGAGTINATEFYKNGVALSTAKPALSQYTAYKTKTNVSTPVIPADDTIPQITEGVEILTLTVTPTNVNSLITLRFGIGQLYASTTNLAPVMALFKDSGANALVAASVQGPAGTATVAQGSMEYSEVAGSLTPRTYRMRVGVEAGTIYLNGTSAARQYGGVSACWLSATESLP